MRLTVGPLTRLTTVDVNRIAYGFPYADVVYVRGSYLKGLSGGSVLNRFICPGGRKCAVIGLLVDAEEPNFFDIVWTFEGREHLYRVRLPGDGVISYDFRPGLNLDLPADSNSPIVVRLVNTASPEKQYKVDIVVGLW